MKLIKDLKFKCPDCLQPKRALIRHHIIPKRLFTYLISVGRFEPSDINNIRKQLWVKICKECEDKFHNGVFYNETETRVYGDGKRRCRNIEKVLVKHDRTTSSL